jgi:starvation-inducible DNA-binding protein
MTNNGSLTPEQRKITGSALQNALVDLISVSLQAKQVHWNLTGSHFRSVHLHLDEVVGIARGHADTLAERAVAIGVNPDGRAETVARDGAANRFASGSVNDVDAVSGMAELLSQVVGRLREGIQETAETDPVSQDLLIGAAHDLDKHRWMFAASRG